MNAFNLCRLCVLILCSWMSFAAYADKNDAGITVLWGYQGNKQPSKWAALSPAFALCAEGKEQSPINIAKRISKTPATLLFYYEPADMMIVEDGLTELTIENTQAVIADGHGIQLNFPADKTKESIMLDDKLYRLVQFHLHTPSEHQLHGRAYPVEIHFVHQGNDGEVVVVGVMVSQGAANAELQKIIDHLPAEKGVVYTEVGERVNPKRLLPVEQDYYSYTGSLTTPPCLEGVEWVVMANPIEASSSQISKLRRAVNGDNARPVQSLMKRRIYFSRK